MNQSGESTDKLLASLGERAKELNCLYSIEDVLSCDDIPLDEICAGIVEAIPPGWQYPDICCARIVIGDTAYSSAIFGETVWGQHADIRIQDQVVGSLSVYYSQEKPSGDDGPFLNDETKLLGTISEMLGSYLFLQKMKKTIHELEQKEREESGKTRKLWEVALDTLKLDQGDLFLRLSYNMLEELRQDGISEAEELYNSWIENEETTIKQGAGINSEIKDKFQERPLSPGLGSVVFDIAAKHFSDQHILDSMQSWIKDNKLSGLTRLVNRNLSVSEVADAIERYHRPNFEDNIHPRQRGIKMSLIRRFLSSRSDYMSVAQEHSQLCDFNNLLQRLIFSAESHGQLGGKGARLFLAERILDTHREEIPELQNVVIPRTWFITSDVLFYFLHQHEMDNVVLQKIQGIKSGTTGISRNSPYPCECAIPA